MRCRFTEAWTAVYAEKFLELVFSVICLGKLQDKEGTIKIYMREKEFFCFSNSSSYSETMFESEISSHFTILTQSLVKKTVNSYARIKAKLS